MKRLAWLTLPFLGLAALAGNSFETIPPEEATIAPMLVKGTEAGLAKGFVELEKKIEELVKEKKDPKGLVKAIRDAHPQGHGCVKAKFEVLSSRDRGADRATSEKLGQGLFAEAKTYNAYIRYSNGSGKLQFDYIPDGRGMAVKVMGVEGERFKLDKTDEKHTQDFLMINFPQFFVKDVKDYAGFFADPGKFMASHPNEMKIAGGIAMQVTTSPIEARYFSMTPILYGKNAVKFSAKPCVSKISEQIGDLDLRPLVKVLKTLKTPQDIAAHVKELSPTYDRYLQKALRNGMAASDLCYDFYVQFQESATTEPIEDPTVKWNTAFYRVARITAEKQDVAKGRTDEFCENLALTPWHAKVEHQPLGGVQRVRKPIYETISDMRRAFNLKNKLTTADLLVEPTGNEKF